MDTKGRILKQIEDRGTGSAFTAKDFAPIASRGTIDVILSRLVKEGLIRRIGRGLYDCPRQSDLLGGPVATDVDEAARAIARKHRWTIAPDGATAANMLGLSQQVPAKIVYLSDGPTRQFDVGQRTILFRHTSPKDLKMEHYSSRLLAQALRFVGRENVTQATVDHLRHRVPQADRKRFLKDARYGTGWILDVAQQMNQELAHG